MYYRQAAILLLVIAGLTGCQLTMHRRAPEGLDTSAPVNQHLPGSASAISLARLEDRVSDIITSSAGDYGVYALLVGTDKELAIEADRAFFAASCYKIPLVLYLYEQAHEGKIDLGESLLHREEDFAPGAGILKDREAGSRYELDHLASLAIIHSDNIAARMLLRRLGRDAFKQYQVEAGAESIPPDRNLASPRDVGLFLLRLLALSDQHPHDFGIILTWMEEALPRDRIPAGLPGDVRVANKTGTWPGTLNDAGLIFSGDSVTVLVVMSEDVPDYGTGVATIGRIARAVYQEFRGQ